MSSSTPRRRLPWPPFCPGSSGRPGGSASSEPYGRPVELDLQAVLFRELNLIGNRVYQPGDMDAALAMLAADPASFRR